MPTYAKPPKEIAHLKKVAKRSKKNNPHVGLMEIQHKLAQYLGFRKWDLMIRAKPEDIQAAIDNNPTDKF